MLIVTKELLFLSSTIFGSSKTLYGRGVAFAWLLSSFSVFILFLSFFVSFLHCVSPLLLPCTFQLDISLPPSQRSRIAASCCYRSCHWSGHLVKQMSISHGALNVIDLSIRMYAFMSFAFCL